MFGLISWRDSTKLVDVTKFLSALSALWQIDYDNKTFPIMNYYARFYL